jgi:hypothetical protein
MLSRQAELKLIAIFLLMIWVVDAEAVIYKWKDDSGKTHFNNDPTKVPEEYRRNPFLKESITLKEGLKFNKDEAHEKKEIVSDDKNILKNKNKRIIVQKEFTDAQLSTVEDVVKFFKEDIQRYDKLYNYPPSRSKFRLIKLAVAGSTVKKKIVLEKASQINVPLLHMVSDFLKTSIAADEKSQKVMPTTIVSTRQTQTLINRLKTESKQEAQLLEKIIELLKARQDAQLVEKIVDLLKAK